MVPLWPRKYRKSDDLSFWDWGIQDTLAPTLGYFLFSFFGITSTGGNQIMIRSENSPMHDPLGENWVACHLLYQCAWTTVLIKYSENVAQLKASWQLYTVATCAKLLQWCPTLYDPMQCSPPGPLSMEFCRQEYWSGLPFPPPGDLPWSRDWTFVYYVSCTGRWVLYH